LLNQVTDKRETVIIKRPDAPDVALIAANELSGLIETIHLLRSPKNAERLLRTLNHALIRTGKAQTVEELRRELGFDDEEEEA
jgi:antitoxin YefM